MSVEVLEEFQHKSFAAEGAQVPAAGYEQLHPATHLFIPKCEDRVVHQRQQVVDGCGLDYGRHALCLQWSCSEVLQNHIVNLSIIHGIHQRFRAVAQEIRKHFVESEQGRHCLFGSGMHDRA